MNDLSSHESSRHGGPSRDPLGHSHSASAEPQRGDLRLARDNVPGARSPNGKALKGRAKPCTISGIPSPTTHRGGRHRIARHGNLARPFRARTRKAKKPKALPWATLRLPLWGASSAPRVTCNHPRTLGIDWRTHTPNKEFHGPNSPPFFKLFPSHEPWLKSSVVSLSRLARHLP